MDIKELESLVPLEGASGDIAKDILNETDVDHLKSLTQLFNLNQAKKNVIRILKLNSLLDKVQDQMIERFEKRPGEFSNDDLLSYMQITQQAIDRANKSLQLVDETPAIQVNQVNINTSEDVILSRESREKIDNVIKTMLSRLNLKEEAPVEEIIVEERNDNNVDGE